VGGGSEGGGEQRRGSTYRGSPRTKNTPTVAQKNESRKNLQKRGKKNGAENGGDDRTKGSIGELKASHGEKLPEGKKKKTLSEPFPTSSSTYTVVLPEQVFEAAGGWKQSHDGEEKRYGSG